MTNVITSPPGRQSFFDDDNLDIKFDWVKVEKPAHHQALSHPPILKEIWTRTLANSQTTVQAYYVLYERFLVQYKVKTCCFRSLIAYLANRIIQPSSQN